MASLINRKHVNLDPVYLASAIHYNNTKLHNKDSRKCIISAINSDDNKHLHYPIYRKGDSVFSDSQSFLETSCWQAPCKDLTCLSNTKGPESAESGNPIWWNLGYLVEPNKINVGF